ncbi:Na/Pi cotransporter family protein [Elusimicrobiota bacterium]
MFKEMIFPLLGGLGFFFFGMQFLSDGLKKVAGEKLKAILHMATKIPLVGILVGAIVTILIQSSSATTVMVVGFVNAGLLALKQAICVIIGANIGTTFTAWLVSSMSVFKVTTYALPAIGIGFVIMQFGKTRKIKAAGQVILGFGILFIGLSFMKDAFSPLKDSLWTIDMFTSLSHSPLLGLLVGLVFTVLLQSSSATLAVIQVLAFSGVLSFTAAIPIMLGTNIGTTVTAQLASVGANLAARRTAMAHTLFNVIGSLYVLIFIYLGWFEAGIIFIMPIELSLTTVMFYIAVSHSIFNIVNTIVVYPFINWLEKTSIWLVPKKPGAVEIGTQYLEKHLLDTPPIALEVAYKETVYMLTLANRSISAAWEGFIKNDAKCLKEIDHLEQAVDNLQSEITQYLIELSQRNLAKEETEELPVLIHSVNDIERIGDHSKNICELADRKMDEKLCLSDNALEGLKNMWSELNSMMSETEIALKDNDIQLAKKVLKREEKINMFQKDLKKGHVERLNKGVCDIKSGIIFVDLIDNLEKIGDHLTNIVQGVLGEMRWKGYKEKKFART